MLTNVVRKNTYKTSLDREQAQAELQIKLTSASLDLADRLLHSAFQEMEAAMFEQVSNRLKNELPELIAQILHDHENEN